MFRLVFANDLGVSEMLNPISSPGDPMFYVHHAFVDKLWWDWEVADSEKRLYAIGGPTVKDPNRPAPVPEGWAPNGEVPARMRKRHEAHVRKHGLKRQDDVAEGNGTTTLQHGISLFGLLEDVTAEDVMDIRNELLCYEYI
ncbi:hypothetical protein CBER1_04743 [Cercospora berteroae]|uniref:Tyrosinase copper-binding domain-containing protein n=1 Tax=Cercospora berteroae TaxID=357750 RepID=A0A2S6BR81_9PEZI|nr:hypothetical protein CBER1_04743 [Cercospora berteroae]